jgi:hypothetical protein
MPSYFLPYPKTKSKHVKHKPLPLKMAEKTRRPYPHPQPDPPNNPPSPLNLSPSYPSPSPSPSSSSSTIKPSPTNWHQDYAPSILKLQIICGNPHDPSLVVVFGLKFREGKRPQVRFSVKRGHGRTRELGESLGLGDDGEGERRVKEEQGRAGGKKRKRGSES